MSTADTVAAGRPWVPGAATAIGSLPGTDPAEAVRAVLGELPELPFLPELPDRGAGADMIGRSAALLVDLPVEIVPSGWRLAAHPGRDLRAARDLLARDLDALEAAADGAAPPVLKVQATGPWTLAAAVELPTGHRVVSDHGATRDLAESLTEGLRAHLADLAQRLPGTRLVLQLDEPGLPSVLAGHVPTASGWGTVRAVDRAVVRQRLAAVLDVVAPPSRTVHCCAPDTPIALLREAGATALALDLALVERAGGAVTDALGEALDAGLSLWLGVVPSTDATVTVAAARQRLLRWWDALGFGRDRLADSVVPTPACGLAGASPAYVRHAFTVLRELGHSLRDDT